MIVDAVIRSQALFYVISVLRIPFFNLKTTDDARLGTSICGSVLLNISHEQYSIFHNFL